MLFNPKWADAKVDAATQLLLKAADLIEKKGWCQGHYYGMGGAHCTQGAIYKIAARYYRQKYNGSVTCDATTRLCEYLQVLELPTWNDAPGRTKEEVVSAMRAAAPARC